MTHDDTGHCCLSNSPLPGLSNEHVTVSTFHKFEYLVQFQNAKDQHTDLIPPQELAPFQSRIFLRGDAGSIGSGGSTPAGGMNINCSASKGQYIVMTIYCRYIPGTCIFSLSYITKNVPGILSAGLSSGKRSWERFCWEGLGETRPPSMYHGRSGYDGGSSL